VGLSPDDVRQRHPHLVWCTVSNFGLTGPYAEWIGTDAVLEAMGGTMFKAGIPSREPLLAPSQMAYDTASIHAVFAVLSALWQGAHTGWGQHIDLSVLEATAQITDWSFPNASVMRAHGLTYDEVRKGSGPVYTIYQCKGGFVRMIILSPRQWRAMRAWLGEPEWLQDDSWDLFPTRLMNTDVLLPLYIEHFAQMSHEEVSFEAQRRGIVCTPVLTPDETLANEHLRSRGSFVDLSLIPGTSGPVASGFFEIAGERCGPRAALAQTAAPHHWDPRSAPAGAPPVPTLPLEGVRVMDFGIGGVGVEAGRMLAEYGADVIKVESRAYPDFIRTVSGSEMSPSFASSSRSKRGFGVNAKTPEGLDLLHRLLALTDIVIENNSTGTMDDMGLGWDVIHGLNPRCVMVSSQLLGSHGAWADWIGYGPSTQPMGGLVHLWNYADAEAPAGSQAIYPDHLAGRLCAIGGLAVLMGRARQGDPGAHVEVAQVEAVVNTLADLLAKAGLAPGSVRPLGNRHEGAAPWGAYRCEGTEQWVVICVRDDPDWGAFREALGSPDWTADPALSTAAGRVARADELDGHLAAWCAGRDRWDVARLLQSHGVPAGPMLTATDQLDDPHLAARGYSTTTIVQPDLGPITMEGPAFRATGMADAFIGPAPKLGEHTRDIARDLLGLDDAEIDRLFAAGVLEGPREEVPA